MSDGEQPTTARELLLWNDSLPEEIRVIESTPEGHATRQFAIVADYGWAERVFCAGMYEHDAHAVAQAIREAIA